MEAFSLDMLGGSSYIQRLTQLGESSELFEVAPQIGPIIVVLI